MSNSNGFKVQYKTSANSSWNTKTSGTEQSCFRQLESLRSQYPHTRVIDSDGRVVS